MKDIVIPYLKNQSGELKACISLIEKNVPHRNIYVVEDYESSRYSYISHINQIQKLDWALKNLDLTEEFYLFNDDFFILEPVQDIPYMHRGTLSDHITSRPHGQYSRNLRITRDWINEDALSYEVHVPFLFNRETLRVLIESLRHGIESGKCPFIRSWYGNCAKVGGVQILDVKNVENYESYTYLSTTEQSFKRGIGEYIRGKL